MSRTIINVCTECSAEFEAHRSDALTCSGACRARRHRRHEREIRQQIADYFRGVTDAS